MEDHFYFRKRIRLGESVKDPTIFYIKIIILMLKLNYKYSTKSSNNIRRKR